MTRWLFLLAIPGGFVVAMGLIVVALVRRSRQQEVDAELDKLIKSPVPKFTGHDEALQQRTQQRREAAAKIRVRAAHVESGAPVSDVLRMVRR